MLSKIKSEYFTFFDSDDYAEPEYIEELFNLMTIYNADLSICGKSRHNENKTVNLTNFNKKQKAGRKHQKVGRKHYLCPQK